MYQDIKATWLRVVSTISNKRKLNLKTSNRSNLSRLKTLIRQTLKTYKKNKNQMKKNKE